MIKRKDNRALHHAVLPEALRNDAAARFIAGQLKASAHWMTIA